MKTLTIKTLTQKEYKIEIANDTSVDALKFEIKKIAGIPEIEQRLIYKGKQLENNRYLSDYNVQDQDTMHLTMRLGAVSKTDEQIETDNSSEETKAKNNDNFFMIGLGLGIFTLTLPLSSGALVACYFADQAFVPSFALASAGCAVIAIAAAVSAAIGFSRSLEGRGR